MITGETTGVILPDSTGRTTGGITGTLFTDTTGFTTGDTFAVVDISGETLTGGGAGSGGNEGTLTDGTCGSLTGGSLTLPGNREAARLKRSSFHSPRTASASGRFLKIISPGPARFFACFASSSRPPVLSTILFRRRIVPVFSPVRGGCPPLGFSPSFLSSSFFGGLMTLTSARSMAAFSFSNSFCFSSSAFFRARSTADGISPSFSSTRVNESTSSVTGPVTRLLINSPTFCPNVRPASVHLSSSSFVVLTGANKSTNHCHTRPIVCPTYSNSGPSGATASRSGVSPCHRPDKNPPTTAFSWSQCRQISTAAPTSVATTRPTGLNRKPSAPPSAPTAPLTIPHSAGRPDSLSASIPIPRPSEISAPPGEVNAASRPPRSAPSPACTPRSRPATTPSSAANRPAPEVIPTNSTRQPPIPPSGPPSTPRSCVSNGSARPRPDVPVSRANPRRSFASGPINTPVASDSAPMAATAASSTPPAISSCFVSSGCA